MLSIRKTERDFGEIPPMDEVSHRTSMWERILCLKGALRIFDAGGEVKNAACSELEFVELLA